MTSDNVQVPLASTQPAEPKATGSTSWVHVWCENGWKIPDPVMGYYTRLPENAACKWSTDQGKNPKRVVHHPLPERPFDHWGDEKVHQLAAHFRQKYPQDMAGLKRPVLFEDLYEYFDGRDLYFQGAWNLWNLINMLFDENLLLAPELLDALRKETDDWVTGWASFVPNRRRLMNWDRNLDVLTVLWPGEWSSSGISELDESKLGMLRVSFVNYYRCLTGYNHAVSPPIDGNRDSQNGHAVTTWLKQTYPSQGFTPPFNSVSHVDHNHKPTGLANTVQNKPTGPKHPVIVNGSKSVVPRIRRSDDTSPLANKGKNANQDSDMLRVVSTDGGSPDSEGTWKSDSYYKPGQPSKEQDAKKSHQSSISDPSANTEPFPKLADSLPFPYNSATGYESSFVNQSAGGTYVEKQTPLAVTGSQRPQTAVPVQHMTAAKQGAPFTNGTQSSQFSGYPPPLSQPPVIKTQAAQVPNAYQAHLHSTQPLQAPVTNGPMLSIMQPGQMYGPAPPDLMAMRGSQQVPPQGVNAYTAQTTQAGFPQPVTPMMYPQMAMPRHMVSMPMQTFKPNLVTQPQENAAPNRRFSNHSKARTSPPRNGWQTKIRDDPIHGAVYVHNRLQKNGSVTGVGSQGPQVNQQTGGVQDVGVHQPCKNANRNRSSADLVFEQCNCWRCLASSRSIFIRDFKEGLLQNQDTINAFKRFFSKYGQIEDLTCRGLGPGRPHAYLRFSHHTQAYATIAALQGPKYINIPGFGERVFVGFPYYSMYYNKSPRFQNRHASTSGSSTATVKAPQGFPSQQMVRQEVQPPRNGLPMDQQDPRMPPYPGFVHPGGVVVHHPLPARPPILHGAFSRHQDPRNGVGSHVSGQVAQPSQQAVFELSHRPTPESLQREIDCLDRSKQGGFPRPPSAESTSEPMDLASTPSSSPATIVGNQPTVNPPITPPDQRDSSSSSSGQGSQGSKDKRAQARHPAPNSADSSTSSMTGQAENPHSIDQTVQTEEMDGLILTLSTGLKHGDTSPSMSSASSRPNPTPSSNQSSSHGDPVAEPNGRTGSAACGFPEVPPSNFNPEKQVTDQTRDSPDQTEPDPEQPRQIQDKKVKYKKNKAKKRLAEIASGNSAGAQAEQVESQRPPSSASQGSSTLGGQKKQKKKSHSKKKKAQPSESAQVVAAVQPAPEAAHEFTEEHTEVKTEEYMEKIKNLFSPPTTANNTPPATSPKERESVGENKRKGYRANAGGSLKMQKNRPPALSQNTFKRPEGSETAQLSTIDEAAPKEIAEKASEISPTAHVFTNQKFEIDQMKSKGQSSKEPKTQEATPKTEVRIGSLPPGFDPYPRPPPSAQVSPRDDVFSPKKDDKKPQETWIHAESVKKTTPDDNKDFVTPSPSPRKATAATPSSIKSNLNPSAKPFTIPPSRSLTPTSTMLTTSTKHGRQSSHISTHSSAPSTSSRVSSDRRYFTPLEQTPKGVTTPPSPKKGKQSQRRGFGVGAPQDEGSNYNNNRKKNTARPSQPKEQKKKSSKPAEPAAPKMSADNFPELPAAKKPLVDVAAPKLIFPSIAWQKPKESGSPQGSGSSKASSKQGSPQGQEKTPPKKDVEKSPVEKGELSPAEWLLQKHRKESMSSQNV